MIVTCPLCEGEGRKYEGKGNCIDCPRCDGKGAMSTITMELIQTVEWKPVFLWFKVGIDPCQHALQYTAWVPQNLTMQGESKLIARISREIVKLLQDVQPQRPIIQGQYADNTDAN